jgi:hypothetical protein
MSYYKKPLYSRNQVKKAGKLYIARDSDLGQRYTSLTIINNWRSAHAYPLQVIYVHLRKTVSDNAIVAQRLKRLESITGKLKRLPNMSLCTMQDIGGCRVVVESIEDVYQIVQKLKSSKMRHKIKEEYDYIKRPKESGYRSYHIVFSYHSDRNTDFNGMFIEVQVRTRVQHMWATAVETMDAFTGDALKTGFGASENRTFFQLASILLEEYEKGVPVDKIRKSKSALNMALLNLKHHIFERLTTIKEAIGNIDRKSSVKQGYYLLRLNRLTSRLEIKEYYPIEIQIATNEYDRLEKNKLSEEDIVLVSTSSFDTLKKAYPNYFADISDFLNILNQLFPRWSP